MVGVVAVVARTVREIVGLLPWRAREAGRLVYGVYQDSDGRWMVYLHGRGTRAVDWTDPPPDLIGQGNVIRAFAKSER